MNFHYFIVVNDGVWQQKDKKVSIQGNMNGGSKGKHKIQGLRTLWCHARGCKA